MDVVLLLHVSDSSLSWRAARETLTKTLRNYDTIRKQTPPCVLFDSVCISL